MSEDMARLILKKELGELEDKLTKRNVTITLTDEAMKLLLKKGFTSEA
jgi:ATP-dependent Clp protease ATP-binding subunit ClpA